MLTFRSIVAAMALQTRTARALMTATGLVCLSVLYVVNPNTTDVPVCPVHAATGLSCPLCGSTRATYALLHGHVVTALRDNLLFVSATPVALLLAARWLAGRPAIQVPRVAYWTALIVLLAFGVLRNLPLASWLVPPATVG